MDWSKFLQGSMWALVVFTLVLFVAIIIIGHTIY